MDGERCRGDNEASLLASTSSAVEDAAKEIILNGNYEEGDEDEESGLCEQPLVDDEVPEGSDACQQASIDRYVGGQPAEDSRAEAKLESGSTQSIHIAKNAVPASDRAVAETAAGSKSCLKVPYATMDDDTCSSSSSSCSQRRPDASTNPASARSSKQVAIADEAIAKWCEPGSAAPGAQDDPAPSQSRGAPSDTLSIAASISASVSASVVSRGRAASLSQTIRLRSRIGHRRVDKTGTVTYKRTPTSHLMHAIQMGIRHSIEAVSSKPERDILVSDFSTVEFVDFPSRGTHITPVHEYSDFTFKAYAPLAFRFFRAKFGIKSDQFITSLTSCSLIELSNPGASGSIFYLSPDNEFIIKTVQNKEAHFLQKLLPGYFLNLYQNSQTLLPKFYGLYCYCSLGKRIRFVVMNNLLPTVVLHEKYDLKGSTYKREASEAERGKRSPTLKDLDFRRIHPEGIELDQESYQALVMTLRRDCCVLESFQIMDYSLLLGIHNLDQAKQEQAAADARASATGISKSNDGYACSVLTGERTDNENEEPNGSQRVASHSRIANSIANEANYAAHRLTIDSAGESHEPETTNALRLGFGHGGIPARNTKGEKLLIYVGIIDILQCYRLAKRLEHAWKSVVTNGDTVSVHRPSFYADRFLKFVVNDAFKKRPPPFKRMSNIPPPEKSPAANESRGQNEPDRTGETQTNKASESTQRIPSNSEPKTASVAAEPNCTASKTLQSKEGEAPPLITYTAPPTPSSQRREAPPTPGSTISSPHEGDGGNVNAQQKGEIEVVFIDALDSKYECVVCEQVLRFPVQFEDCGHRCCSSCLPDLITAFGTCPVDQAPVSREKIYVDRAFQREIDSLGVKCSFCISGCEWTGMLKELVNHFGECMHMIIPCPLNCGLEFEKRYLEQHLAQDCSKRDVNCKYCSRQLQADEELAHHQTDCPRFPVPCPNNCKKKEVPREELESHLETQCTRQDYPCPFGEFGCEFSSIKRKIKDHCRQPDDMERHLHMLCEAVKQLKAKTTRHNDTLEDHSQRVVKLEQKVQNIEKIYGAQLVWRIENFKQRFEDAKSGKKPTLFSPPFLTSRHGYKMALSVCPFGDGKSKGKYLSLFICICRGEFDPLLNWPFAHKITFTLIDQCEDPSQQRNVSYHIKPNVCKENEPFLGRPRGERNASFGAQKFVELQVLNTLDYIRDDAIYIRVECEMDSMLLL